MGSVITTSTANNKCITVIKYQKKGIDGDIYPQISLTDNIVALREAITIEIYKRTRARVCERVCVRVCTHRTRRCKTRCPSRNCIYVRFIYKNSNA